MNEHKFHQGVCTKCGCDKPTIDYFGWSCSGRTILHDYVNDVCINCGFCKAVVTHFDWPCRLDYRTAHGERIFERSGDRRTDDETRSGRMNEHCVPSQHQRSDERRFGALLGLKGKVTKFDIRCAYREQANLYHPDRVAHLAREIQELATTRMREINQAFEFFKTKYGV